MIDVKKIKCLISKERIDKYLVNELQLSRSLIARMIDDEAILVNGQVVNPNYQVKENDIIEVEEDYFRPMDITKTKMDLNIVYEDKDIMVINKPSGLVVHPGSGNYDNTLVNGLLHYTDSLSDINGDVRPGIVHRLDKDTSGLMLVAKSNSAHEILAEDFKNKRVIREYIALLDGIFPHQSAKIDAPIGRNSEKRKQMMVTADNSKSAITNLKVIKHYAEHTLVSLLLETGRTHQIRVHMAYIGYPVHNDPVYNTRSSTEFGQFLHSAKINFNHPITKESMSFTCPLPDNFQTYLNQLD